MKARLIVISLVLAACTPELPKITLHLQRPVDMAVICDGPATEPCVGYVLNSETGGITRVGLASGDFEDHDSFIPGTTPVLLGGRPVAITRAADGKYVYVANMAAEELVRMEHAKAAVELGGSVVVQALPGRPSAVVDAGDALFVALPDQGAVARIETAEFGNLDAAGLTLIALDGGSPFDLAITSDGKTLYVGHADVAWLSIVDLDTATETSVVPIAPECSDDIDNNGDGLADAADFGCRYNADGLEAARPDGVEDPAGIVLPDDADLPQCANGVDDDGDGLTDFPDAPGCQGPTSPLESWARPPVLTQVALSPDDKLVYALNQRDTLLVAIDAQTGDRIDINADGAPGANRLFRRLGRFGLKLIGVPTDVAFARALLEKDSETKDGRLRAYVASAHGGVEVLDVEDRGESAELVHRFRDGDSGEVSSIVPDPRLFLGDTEIVLGGNRHADRPSFGEFIREKVVGEKTLRYGIDVNQDEPRVAHSEVWQLTHGGALIERRLKIGAYDPHTKQFMTPERVFCSSGVEPGDQLVVHTVVESDAAECEKLKGGSAFMYEIAAVTERRLTLVEGDGVMLERLEDPTSKDKHECSIGPEPGCAADDEECVFGRCRKIVPAMSEACFGGAVSYDVRVPQGTFRVSGSVSGYLHRWSAAVDGTCVEDTDATDFVSRAHEWTPATTDPLLECPLLDSDAATAYQGTSFKNHAFELSIFPGCNAEEDDDKLWPAPTELDVRWQFQVDSSFGPRFIDGMGIPRRLLPVGTDGKLYVIDSGQEKLIEIEAGSDIIRNTFF